MKTFSLIVLLFVSVPFVKAQTLDVGYYGDENYRPVMGGGEKVNIDSVTSLSNLIKKFESKWEFAETGKAYWIGYTDNMYSIARYKDIAIEPLISFINSSNNVRAKQGALYTLHLIGINRHVVGRFYETFVNKNARNALLQYLDDPQLNETVVFLIMRDPWLSDMPKLMHYLARPGADHSKTLSALRRYNFEGKPFRQKITDTLFHKNIDIPFDPLHGMRTDWSLAAFQRNLAPNFVIDKEITESTGWKQSIAELAVKGKSTQNTDVVFFLSSDDTFSFCDFDDSYNYIFKDHKIEIYGPVKGRQIWLNWWANLPQDKKDTLFTSDHVPFKKQ